MKKLALILLFLVPYHIVHSAPIQVTTNPGKSASFERTASLSSPGQVSFEWSPGEFSSWVETWGSQLDAFEENDVPISFRTSVPSFSNLRHRLASFEWLRQSTPLPDDLSRALDQVIPADHPVVEEGQQIIFRDISLSEFIFTPFVKEGNDWYALDRITTEVSVETSNEVPVQSRSVAPSFYEIYSQLLTDNELDELGTPTESGGYLLVGHSIYIEELSDWIGWKKQLGYPVQVIELEGNATFHTVRLLIHDAYNDAELKPEFCLLVGDPVLGTYRIPADYIPGSMELDVMTDHHYATITGNDDWPEIWVGRWSVTTLNHLRIVAAKSIAYERGLNMSGTDGDWIGKGLVICDNTYSSTGLTSSWVRERMVDYGYSYVDSVFFPPHQDAAPISDAINDGRGWVNYRGFGSPTSWIFPVFTNYDAISLNNSWKTPIVTSIVCGGGAYDYNEDPCLGEGFLRAGSVNTPRGAIAFVGPSDLDTHTRWNNCMTGGIFTSALTHGVETFSSAVFMGKMAIWEGFPNNREPGDSHSSVYFYFDTYNILGDPGFKMRTRPPLELTSDHPLTIPHGSNNISVYVEDENGSPIQGARVTIVGDTTDFGPITSITGDDGLVRLDFEGNLPGEGDYIITADKLNMIPSQTPVTFESQSFGLQLTDLSVSAPLTPGETITLAPELMNSGTEATGELTATLSATESGVSITNGTATYTSLAPGASNSNEIFTIEVDLNAVDTADPGLILELDNASDDPIELRLPLHIEAPRIETITQNLVVDPQDNPVSITVEVVNQGPVSTGDGTLMLTCDHPAISMIDTLSYLGVVTPGSIEEGNEPFTFTVSSNIMRGEPIAFDWEFVDGSGRVETGVLNILPGEKTVADPYGPDSYGYRAYDTADTWYWASPQYEWFELDPSQGSPGIPLNLWDAADEEDISTVIDVPFTIQYYGQTFDQLTICSNGWVKPGASQEINFRNWNLPGGLGPMNLIAPFWDDLRVVPGQGNVCYFYDEYCGRLIVEWSHVRVASDPNNNRTSTFQVMIYDPEMRVTPTGDSEIEFHYNEIHDNDSQQNYSTVGIRNHNGTSGLELHYAHYSHDELEPLGSGVTYLLTTRTLADGIAPRVSGYTFFDDGSNGSIGNGNGIVEAGETIAIELEEFNFGFIDATDVRATLETYDSYVEFINEEIIFDFIGSRDSATEGYFLFEVTPHTPDHFPLGFKVVTTDDDEYTWRDSGRLVVRGPYAEVDGIETVDDSLGGNGNGGIEAGESVSFTITIQNTGVSDLEPFDLILHPDENGIVTVLTGTASSGLLEAGETIEVQQEFEITISQDAPQPGVLRLPLDIEVDGQIHRVDSLSVPVGVFEFYDTFEVNPEDNWTSFNGDWHVSSVLPHSPNRSLRWGNVEGDSYSPNRIERILTRPFILPGPATLNLWIHMNIVGYLTLYLVHVEDQDTSALVFFNNPADYWTERTYSITPNTNGEQVQLMFQATTYGNISGSGIQLDDIVVIADEQEIGLEEELVPTEFAIDGPWPNPFNPLTSVTVALPQAEFLDVRVFDILGREVAVLANEGKPSGWHHLSFEATNLASGIYFVKVDAGKYRTIKKAVLMR